MQHSVAVTSDTLTPGISTKGLSLTLSPSHSLIFSLALSLSLSKSKYDITLKTHGIPSSGPMGLSQGEAAEDGNKTLTIDDVHINGTCCSSKVETLRQTEEFAQLHSPSL